MHGKHNAQLPLPLLLEDGRLVGHGLLLLDLGGRSTPLAGRFADDGLAREFLKAVLAADQVEEGLRRHASRGHEHGGRCHVKHARAIRHQPGLGLVQSLASAVPGASGAFGREATKDGHVDQKEPKDDPSGIQGTLDRTS
jgi:hypothetical protein